MKLERRELLKAAAAALTALPLVGCESIYSHISKELGEKIPSAVSVPESKNIDPVFHLLSRAAWGPWPGDVERVKALGTNNWIEEQLAPEKIDDRACDLRARRFETLLIPPGSCYDFKKQSLRLDIVRHTLLRAIYSKRQLFEVMVSFWTDHLNVSIDKGDCIYLKPSDDRLVIRAHALGKFKDLIRHSALSPAMLVYLDGKENRKAGPNGVPNENYARELLELHTLGVHGGYSQHDVYELARCLTGWRLHDDWQRAQVYFDASNHDNGEKILLGQKVKAGGGEKDLDAVIDIVCKHPSTARYISSKMAARFVNEPSASLVDQLAAIFTRTEGDIKEMLRHVLQCTEFQDDRGSKVKRPFHFVVSVCRALAADTHAHDDLIEYLQRMGQPPFQFPTPDGYPDEANYWLGNLLWRWKFAIAIASGDLKNAEVKVDELIAALGIKKNGEAELGKFFAYFAGRMPSADELQALKLFTQNCSVDKNEHRAELAGLIMSSPAFQRC